MMTSSVECRMMLWNVWSVAKTEKLNNLLQIIEDKQINIACITETWFESKTGTFTKAIKEAGYKINHAYREKKRGGGCAIIYQKKLSIKNGEVSSDMYLSFEYATVILNLKSGTKMTIVCLYRKQEIPFKLFSDELTLFMDRIMKMNTTLMIVGDFNTWVDDEDDKNAETLLDLMHSYGLMQHISDHTQRSGHTIDHVYYNPYQFESKHQVIHEEMGFTTDHYPIIIEIPSGEVEDKTVIVHNRKLKNIDLPSFKHDLLESLNSIDFENSTFAEYNTEFDQRSRIVVDKHAPVVSWKRKNAGPLWIDAEYKKNRALRRKYERMWKKDKSDINMNRYIHQKELCTIMAAEKQRTYYSKVLEDAGKCQKTLFKVANELLDKKGERVFPVHTDSKKLANEFNQFFINKVQKIRDSIPDVTENSIHYSRPFQGQMLSEFEPTTEEELTDIINDFGIKTSVEDPIPAKLIQGSLEILLPVYKVLVNKSLSEGNMDTVKCSVIDPLLKKSGLDIDIYKNYRPVNNLIFFSKLIERVVKKRTDQHMTLNALHEPSEYGYKTHHNTETMLLEITNEALQGFENNQATIIVFFDLSAAFDTIDPDKLLQILHDELGITGVALKWFKSFLVGRKQRVKVNNEFSDYLEVIFGAPQGSILGPPLFNINVRSQSMVFRFCKFGTSSFADDSNGRMTFALPFQYNVLKTDVVDCMKHIVEWSHAHFMKINPDKTELLLMYPPSLNKEVLIKGVLFEEECIRFAEYVKNVGVCLDKNLSMNKHVNNITSHCYKILKDIGKIRKNLRKDHLENLVHSVVTSRLDYCNSLFLNISKENLYKLQKVQNSAARLVLGKRKRESAREALRELHWLNIESRIVFKVLLLVFKIVRGMCTENLTLTYKSFNGRPSDFLLLDTPNVNTKYGKRLFEYNGSRLWNALSFDVRNDENIESFKKKIKTLLFDGCTDLKKRAFKYS